jgi:hypothetical protein
MAHRPPTTRSTPRRSAKPKNLALVRWLRRFADRPNDRDEQWWRELETLLQRTRPRLRSLDS